MTTDTMTVEEDKLLTQMVLEAPDGELTKFAAATQQPIRRKLRERAISPKVIEHEKIGNADLDYTFSEEPMLIGEMEPESLGAVSMDFHDYPDTETYNREQYVIYISTIATPELVKNVDQLRKNKTNIREMVEENSLLDLDYIQDARFFSYVEYIAGSPAGVGLSGAQQWFEDPGRPRRENYVDSINHLEDAQLANGVFVCNRKMANEFVKWGRDEMGGDLAQRLMEKGREAIVDGMFLNIPHVWTIKRQLVPDYRVYQFAPTGMLGRACVLEDTTLFVEKKRDILRFSAYKKLGVTIANVAGVTIHDFNTST